MRVCIGLTCPSWLSILTRSCYFTHAYYLHHVMSIIDDAAMDLTTTACQEQQPQPQPPKRLPLLDHQCSHCFAERSPALKNLYICSGCRVVRYCSRDHQLAHWSTHKPLCLPIKRVKAIAESEERKISMNPGSFKGRNGAQEGWEAFYMPGNPFEHAIDFWGWEATRTYMQARWGLVDGLRRVSCKCIDFCRSLTRF